MKTPKRTVSVDDYFPALGYILLKPERDEAVSEGGIHIPDQARRKLNEGEVLKVGSPSTDYPYKVGMFIVFEPASDHELEIEKGHSLLVVHENNVIMYRNPQTPLFPIPPAMSYHATPESSVGGALGRELK